MFPPQCSFVEVGSWQCGNFKLFWFNVQSKAKHSLYFTLLWSRWGGRWQDYIWSCKTVHANQAFMAQALLLVEFWNWEDLDYFQIFVFNQDPSNHLYALIYSWKSNNSVVCSFPHDDDDVSWLQAKAPFTFEFIGTSMRALSILSDPYQALRIMDKTTNKVTAESESKRQTRVQHSKLQFLASGYKPKVLGFWPRVPQASLNAEML